MPAISHIFNFDNRIENPDVFPSNHIYIIPLKCQVVKKKSAKSRNNEP
jgi:hypothetical protein